MSKLLVLVLALPAVACVIGSDSGSSSDTGSSTGAGSGSGVTAPAHVSADTTWTGTINVPASGTTVDANITLTIAAGTKVQFLTGAALTVAGTVDIQGSKGSTVNLAPGSGVNYIGGFQVPAGGQLKMAYGVFSGGNINVTGGGLTVTDTFLSRAPGDLIIMTGGTLNVSYSQIGLDSLPGTDSTHCDLHFNSITSASITHSVLSTSAYGIMLDSGTNVDLTYNNWVGNQTDVYTEPAIEADVSNGWFAKTAPVPVGGAMLIMNNLSPTRLPAGMAGPR